MKLKDVIYHIDSYVKLAKEEYDKAEKNGEHGLKIYYQGRIDALEILKDTLEYIKN